MKVETKTPLPPVKWTKLAIGDDSLVSVRIEIGDKYADFDLDKALLSLVPKEGLANYIAGEMVPFIEGMIRLE